MQRPHKGGQPPPRRLIQRVADGQRRPGDRLQVIQHQQVALGPQPVHQLLLPRRRAQRPQLAVVAIFAIQLPPQAVQDLLQVPGPLVVAKIGHLLHQAGALPPAHQVAQQAALARPAQPAHQQNIAARRRQHPSFDGENVQVAPHKAIGWLRGLVARRLALQVGAFRFRAGKGGDGQSHRPVLVNHRQQPILQLNLLVIGRLPLAVIVQGQPPLANRLGRRLAGQQLAVQLAHQLLGRRHRHRIAHGHHQLRPGGHQAAAQAGLGHRHGHRRGLGLRRRLCPRAGRLQLFGRLAGVQNGDGDLVGLHQAGNDLIGHRFGRPLGRAIEKEKRLLPRKLGDSGAAVARLKGQAAGQVQVQQPLAGGLVMVMAQQAAVQVKMDDVVMAAAVPVAAFFQVADQRFVAARPDQVDPGPDGAVGQGGHQRPGDGAVVHVAAAPRPGGHQQDVQRGRGARPGIHIGRGQVLAQEGRLHRQGAGQGRVLQRFPVQGMKSGRPGNFDDQPFQPAGQAGLVVGINVGVFPENLPEKGLAVGGRAAGGLGGALPLHKRVAEPRLVVPGQLLLLGLVKGVADAGVALRPMIKNNGHGEAAARLLRFFPNFDVHGCSCTGPMNVLAALARSRPG